VIDMGAIEYYIPLTGDINQDGILNVLDLVQVVGCILDGEPENCDAGDVNEDAVVDVLDIVQIFGLILEN